MNKVTVLKYTPYSSVGPIKVKHHLETRGIYSPAAEVEQVVWLKVYGLDEVFSGVLRSVE